MQLIVEAPINPLSFGNVTYNLLRQFWRKGVDVMWYPLGGNANLESFNKIEKDFVAWLEESAKNANRKVKKDIPCFKLWHLNGSQSRIGSKQFLYSFHELDQLTAEEINLAKFQDKVWFSSSYAANLFRNEGIDAGVIPVGFDEDFHKTNKQYLSPDIVHFGLMGKFEKRKHTEKIIKLWLAKYGNNNKYQLSVLVTNPFFKEEEMKSILANCLEGKRYTNINLLPYLKTNSEVNDLTSGFIIIEKNKLNKKHFENSNYGEYFIEVVTSLIVTNTDIEEIGYVCETRKYGKSKTAASVYQLLSRGIPYIKTAYKFRKKLKNANI